MKTKRSNLCSSFGRLGASLGAKDSGPFLAGVSRMESATQSFPSISRRTTLLASDRSQGRYGIFAIDADYLDIWAAITLR